MHMAQYIPLDAAAAVVGKSEVTLRRLIKADKIPFRREKTLTGFVYVIDIEAAKAYYDVPDVAPAEEPAKEEKEEAPAAKATTVRVGIANQEGSTAEYWQKRSESYEDRYHGEVGKHAQTREELGVWRGRAEQAQSMLVKLLPSNSEVEVQKPREAVVSAPKEGTNTWMTVLLIAVIAALTILIGFGGYEYVKLVR